MPPAPTARLNDYARLLSVDGSGRVERLLTQREKDTGVQMAIAIFPSLEGESLEDFSIRLAEKWRIGQKELSNGIILVVFVKERKMRFEVGYGLEPVIPDAKAGQIVREVIAPRFREGRYAEGLADGILAVYAPIEGGKTGQTGQGQPQRAPAKSGNFPILGFAVVIAIIAFILISEAWRSRRFGGGHGYTGGGSGWVLPIAFFLGVGSGGGGRSEGSEGSGGSGDGGGFSGGGGDFGGGGASGDW